MTRPHVTKSAIALGFSTPVALAVMAASTVASHAEDARGEDKCVLHGQPTMADGLGIFDAPNEGTEIAHFTGVKVALRVTAFGDGAMRSHIETEGFHVAGYVRTRDIPVYTAHPVPVYGGHLSIGEGRRVSVVGATGSRLRVERTATSPIAGVFQAWAPCDAVSLAPGVPPTWAPPGGARGYVVRQAKMDLFERPKGGLFATIARAADGPGIVFWGSDSSDGFVHVEHHGDLVVDAWARLRDLAALPPGDTAEGVAPVATQTVVPKPQLQGRARVVRAPNAVELRGTPTEAAIVIGGIDAGVQVVVVDVVGTWARVMPVTFAIAPTAPAEFWVHTRDLGV
jgi:hypothetical protein